MAIIKIGNPAIDLDAAEIPNLPASKITSGTFADARIADLAAAKLTGTIATARLGSDGEIGEVSKATGVNALFSDATLTVLSNKNNPIVNVFFRDLYPIAMSALDYNQQATDVEYLTATVDFAYQIYEIEPIV